MPIAGQRNVAPVAILAAAPARTVDQLTGEAAFEVEFDASDSYDPDGEIVQYDWDFDSDGTYEIIDGDAVTTWTYEVAGEYTCTVRVTDDGGLTSTATADIIVTEPVVPPEAIGSGTQSSEDPLTVTYDARDSFDTDGEIVRYDWDFDNDGEYELIGGGPNPNHTFPDYGTYTVGVRVTDEDGLTDTALIIVTLAPDNVPPTASVTATPESGNAPGLAVVFDASGSTDPDGTIVQYDWDLDNDGTYEVTAGGVSQSSTYDAGGLYTVGVLVTDDDGATDSATVTVDVNDPPVAALTANPASGTSPLDVAYDASGSTDSDGDIARYDWDMDNDGTYEITDGGATQSATYPDFGAYTVGVLVTDDDGATDAATADVTVYEPENIPPDADLAATPAAGNAPELGVTFDASGSTDSDGDIVRYDWDMENDGTFEITDGGVTQTDMYDEGGLYTVAVRVHDDDGATDTATATVDVNNPPMAALTATPDAGNAPELGVTYDASGSTDSDGTIVRYDWDMDNDGTYEITDGGMTQMQVYDTGGLFTVWVRVTDDDGASSNASAVVDVNNPPDADLVANPDHGDAWGGQSEGLEVVYDASGSTDIDGDIVRFDWDMDNDGTFEIPDGGDSQMTVYFEGGLYTVTVLVTDDEGATDTASATCDVNEPPIGDVVATPSSGTAPLSVNFDASGSFDSDGEIVQYDWDMDGDGIYEISGGGTIQSRDYPDGGSFFVQVRVTDDDGALGYGSAFVDVNEPPVADVYPYPDFGPAPLFVEFFATGSDDPDGTIVQYDWDMDNNGTFEIPDGGDYQTLTYPADGVYTVVVQVTDDDGAQDTDSAVVTVETPPIPILTGTYIGSFCIEWDASASYDPNGGTIEQYDWDFDNDGEFETVAGNAIVVICGYEWGETVTVGVQVTDNDGLTASITATVIIDEPD